MDILPSLGASGAIYAAVTMTALAFPDAHVSPLLLPSVEIPAQWGVGTLVLMDIIGVLRGWRRVFFFVRGLTHLINILNSVMQEIRSLRSFRWSSFRGVLLCLRACLVGLPKSLSQSSSRDDELSRFLNSTQK